MNLNRTQPWVIALAMTGVVCADPLMNTAGMMGVSRTSSSYLMGQASLDVGVSAKADYAYEGARIHYFGEEVRQNPVLLSQDIYLAFGMTNWMDVSVDLPMYEDIWKNHDYYPSGVGDLQLGVKIQHPGLYLEAPFPWPTSCVPRFPPVTRARATCPATPTCRATTPTPWAPSPSATSP